MAYLFALLKTLRSDDKGATAIEYGLIAALIAVAAIVGMTAIGDGLEGTFDDVACALGMEEGRDCDDDTG